LPSELQRIIRSVHERTCFAVYQQAKYVRLALPTDHEFDDFVVVCVVDVSLAGDDAASQDDDAV
jgi:hypothetical protein